MLPYLLWGWAFLASGMAVLWVVQARTQNAASVDLAWAAGLDLLVIGYAATYPSYPARRALVCLLGGLWAMRLAFHLYHDRVRGQAEDGGYRAMREAWGARAPRNFFFLYQGQALVAALFSVPMLVAMRGPGLDRWCAAGVVVWLVAVAGETVAERRMVKYLFACTHWFAYVVIGHGALLTWLGPALMLVFFVRPSGMPRETGARFPWFFPPSVTIQRP